MPMSEGTVTINPTTGAASGSGCAKEVFDALAAGQDYGDLSTTNPPVYAASREQLAVMARAMAKVIPHIQANAQVPSGIPVSTTGTAAAQSGATTSPGTVT